MDGPPGNPSLQSVRGAEGRASYRPEIDGLRAIAVLVVLGFHFFPAWCRAGFVGVDVFFVISGFLISGILLRDQRSRTETLVSFYQHRVRRIFPALLLVLTAAGLAGWFVLLPDEFAELRREILASCAFVANFLFARTDNYFDQASSTKVLLHLWSLSIEEQFYLVWPAIVVIGKSWRHRGPLFLTAMAASLTFCILLGVSHPVDAFFSPLTRTWELGLGGFLAWKVEGGSSSSAALLTHQNGSSVSDSTMKSVAGIMGIGLVLGSAFLIDATWLYPGMLATLPTIGAFLIIAAGGAGPVGRLLGSRVALAIGRISYPLYLWHWPILVLATLIFGEAMGVSLKASLIALAVVLAQLTYSLIELPVRRNLSLARSAYLFATLMLLLAAVFVLVGHKQQDETVYLRGVRSWTGGMNRQLLGWFSPDPACIAQLDLEDEAKQAGKILFCSMSAGSTPLSVAVIGDSTANSLYPGMAQLYARSGRRVFNVGNGTCAPFRGVGGTFKYNRVCMAVNDKVYRYILASKTITTVILSFTPWDIRNMLIPGLAAEPSLDERFAAMQPLVRRDVDALIKAGKKVILTFDAPRLSIDPRVCINDASKCVKDGGEVIGALEPYRSKWQQLVAATPGVCVFSQRDLFRQPDGHYQFTRNDLLLFRDDHHLSTLGSEFVANAFSASDCFK